MVRKNSMKAVAPTRGVTSFLVGSVPRARMASICSVTIMEPSSLAMPEALRPATISPVISGPSSRDHADGDQLADQRDPAKSLQGAGRVQRQQRADGESGQNHDGQRADADQVRLLQHVAHVERAAEEVCERLRRRAGCIPEPPAQHLWRLQWAKSVRVRAPCRVGKILLREL